MTNLEKMKLVDNLTNDISMQIGVLTKHGVITFEEGVEFIRTMSNKQFEWLRANFTEEEYREYLIGKTG